MDELTVCLSIILLYNRKSPTVLMHKNKLLMDVIFSFLVIHFTYLHLAFAVEEASVIRARILKPFIVDSKIHNEVPCIRINVLLYGKSQVF